MTDVDQWIEIAKDCKYLPENDLKVIFNNEIENITKLTVKHVFRIVAQVINHIIDFRNYVIWYAIFCLKSLMFSLFQHP